MMSALFLIELFVPGYHFPFVHYPIVKDINCDIEIYIEKKTYK